MSWLALYIWDVCDQQRKWENDSWSQNSIYKKRLNLL